MRYGSDAASPLLDRAPPAAGNPQVAAAAGALRRLSCLLLLFCTLLAPPTAAAAEPYRPGSDDTVLLKRSAGAAKALRESVGIAETADPVARAAAAGAAIELARRSGDPRYFGKAQALLGGDWTASAPTLPMRLLRATLRQQRHDFDAALQDLAAVLAEDPQNPQALLMRASIRMVQGEPQQARQDCIPLIGKAGFLVAATCIGSANALQGQAAAGLVAIELALARDTAAPVATRLWALTQAAEIAERLGDVAKATEYFAKAQAQAEDSGSNDVYLQAAQADFLLLQGRADEVASQLADKTDFDPLLLRLALAESQRAARGDARAAAAATRHTQQLLTRFALAEQRGDAAHLREQGIAALHLQAEPQRALAIAQRNWAEQREPADALLLLQAAKAAGSADAAQTVVAWMRRTDIEDVRLQPLASTLEARP